METCRRCGGAFEGYKGSTICARCFEGAVAGGEEIRFTCSRCVIYGECRCDICGVPSLHVGAIPHPTFRCSGCADKERQAYMRRRAQFAAPTGRTRVRE